MTDRPDSYIPPYDYYLLAGSRVFYHGESIWRKRGTRDWLLIATIAGTGRIGYGLGSVDIGPGEWILLSPGAAHDYGISPGAEAWEIRWAHFIPRPYWLEWMAWPEISPGLRHLRIGSDVCIPMNDLFDCLIRHFSSGLPGGEMHAMAMLEEIFLKCAQIWQEGQPEYDQQIENIAAYVEANLQSPIGVADLCHVAGTTKGRIVTLIREEFGLSPRAYVESRRMAFAKHQLDHTSFSISEISELVGYSTPFHFSRRFHEIVGVSPRQYRKRDEI